jgi:serine/threonine protein kinase
MNYDLFISYRRDDSSEAVSLLYQYLSKDFAVFADTAEIKPADTWSDRIKTALESAKIMLVVIGKNWLRKDSNSKRLPRICMEDDWVRKEIETAIELNKKIIPLLIGVDNIPTDVNLPEKIKAIAGYQFIKIDIKAGENAEIKPLREQVKAIIRDLKTNDEIRASLGNKYGDLIKIGSTGKANIYLGKDFLLDRRVAIKVIKNEDFEDEFVEVIKDAVKINEIVSNSIVILKASRRKPLHVIMKYFEKGTLRKIINEEKGMQWPFGDTKSILISIGKAFVKMHEKELTYCNLKPSNILLNDELEPYLNTFSRVKKLIAAGIIADLKISQITNPATMQEELSYLPPELFQTKASSDTFKKRGQKIDQYMLGLLAYELLTGQMPETVADLAELEEKRSRAFKQLTPIQQLRNDCPAGFADIVHKMLEYNPDKRFNDLKEAIERMEKFSFDVYEIANESYARCLSVDERSRNFFQTFYNELIRISPAAATKFKRRHIGDNPVHKQYHVLREAIFILLMFGKNNTEANSLNVNVLTRIAEKHNRKGYKVTREEYADFVCALTNTICGSSYAEPFDEYCKMSDDEKEIIRNAWTEALRPGIEYMIKKF